MRNPIYSFDIIKDNFIRYVETAFDTKFDSVDKERRDILNRDKVLYREPWIEPLPDYKSSGKYISSLSKEDLGDALNDYELDLFKGLVKTGLFSDSYPLHFHQAEMLRKVMGGKHCIITSGTGSGKTESFLLPLFAQLSKELASWGNSKGCNSNKWWNNESLKDKDIVSPDLDYELSINVRQRPGDNRPQAVRALILYPMNALVEDQLTRLRKSLDSDNTRAWLKENAKNNAIYFGRYNGNTPTSGELFYFKDDGSKAINKFKIGQLREELKKVDNESSNVIDFFNSGNHTSTSREDLLSFFPRLDGAEMRCRFDMQVAPPDIMITNYSMLSIMLMRDVDDGIFNKTKDWLYCEDEFSIELSTEQKVEERKNRIFHLIIDELHLYRGTQGTEVAYLLKLILSRLGLHPGHEQLKILASSASLDSEDEKSLEFIQDFFGVTNVKESFEIIVGVNNPIEKLSNNQSLLLPVSPFKAIKDAYYDNCEDLNSDGFKQACYSSAHELMKFSMLSIDDPDEISLLLRVLVDRKLRLRERLYKACLIENNERAVCSIRANGDNESTNILSESIFGNTSSNEDLRDALGGLFILRSLYDMPIYQSIEGENIQSKLPRFRFHFFFRNIEGLWGSLKPDDNDKKYNDELRTVGRLYPQAQIKSNKGYRVLELLYCDSCGTTLFGGSRLRVDDSTFELLPLSPNIEGIPEKTPHKLLERRTYQDYAVFWPMGKQDFEPHEKPQKYWHQTTVGTSIDQVLFRAQWVPACINIYSGDVKEQHTKFIEEPNNWIKGYYFKIVSLNQPNLDIAYNRNSSNEGTHKATPCVCPACGINHSKWNNDSPKIKISPIRGFRTGFAKSSQMFAKELLYQLPNNPEERKLVVFSDSREDSAQVANGIERNHFIDLLRELLIKELNYSLITKLKILTAFKGGDGVKVDEFRSTYSNLVAEVEEIWEDANTKSTTPKSTDRKNVALKQIKEIEARIIRVRDLVEYTSGQDLAPLIKKLVELGINPGGNDIRLQTALHNNSVIKWYDVVDFENMKWIDGVDPNFVQEIKKGTFSKLATMFFASLFYSFESSALGFLTINPETDKLQEYADKAGLRKNDFLDIVNSSIRILGDKYKHNQIDDENFPLQIVEYKNLPILLRDYIWQVGNSLGIDPIQIGQNVFNLLTSLRILRSDTGLQFQDLYIKVSIATDKVWITSKGKRAHLHFSGGFCTQTKKHLDKDSNIKCEDIWDKNYISYTAIKLNRQPIRLHCEELTGQTDNQFQRQRHFRNVVLPNEGNALVKRIDLLSVTTTLEVGVDIGALQAVMLANMPPQRFNYQQRVGRAGRRGQAYSVVLTFCRGRSHDEFYFSNPQRITGDRPPTPFLTMKQERICLRLITKEILRQAFKTIDVNENNDEDKSSIHGVFGKVHNWSNYKEKLVTWISSNGFEIDSIINTLLPIQLLAVAEDLHSYFSDTETGKGFISRLQTVIDNSEIPTDDISQKFAESGILPMFGMPTDVKNLYHGIARDNSILKIDRPQAMAIYEFAPMAQKTKDKAIYQSIGFTSEMIERRSKTGSKFVTNKVDDKTGNSPFYLSRWMERCKKCGYNKTYGESTKPTNAQCPYCGNPEASTYSVFVIKSPKSYRTNLLLGTDSKDESEFITNRPPIYADHSTDDDSKRNELYWANCKIVISDKDVTWRVNSNGDKLYKGSYCDITNYNNESKQTHYFYNQWVADGLNSPSTPSNDNRVLFSKGFSEEPLAIAINKKTEILKIFPISVPQELNLDMFKLSENPNYIDRQSLGVRAGFYSAAFILQRVLADSLDIDPTEVEIADITKVEIFDTIKKNVAEIIMTDELPNGSGFVRHLYNNFSEILDETLAPRGVGSYIQKIHSVSHRASCEDACYDCLKVYRNMNWHSLLDWRLGLGILQLIKNGSYKSGADGRFVDYTELKDWLETAFSLRDQFIESFFVTSSSSKEEFVIDFNGIPAIKHGSPKRGRRKVILIVHPFWNLEKPEEDAWYTVGMAEAHEYISSKGGISEDDFECLDTFNLQRRIGWCYQKIMNK